MNAHPDRRQLIAFARREGSAAERQSIDRHLLGCDACRALLAASAARASDRDAAARVVLSGAHLAYEQLQGYVDARLAPAQRAAADAHLARCPLCRAELDDLQRFAPSLRAPLPAPPAAAPVPGWRRWFTPLPALAMAGVVGAVALTVVLQQQRSDEAGAGPASSRRSDPPQPPPVALFDHGVLQRLAALSPAAAAAWQAGDHARLAALLRPLADAGQPQALAALASLHAQGLGVAQDLAEAERLWRAAAARGDAASAHNLRLLGPPPAPR